jgi:hypothetical protein
MFLSGTTLCDFLGINKTAAAKAAEGLLNKIPPTTADFDLFQTLTKSDLEGIDAELAAGNATALCNSIRQELRQKYPSVFRK